MVKAAVAVVGLTVYCHEVIVVAICRMIMLIKPAKMRVRLRNLSMIYEPNNVKTKYIAVEPS